MAREYIVYKGEEVVVPASTSPLEITGVDPNTNVPVGTYQVGFAEGGEKTDVPAFKTLPIAVTGLEFSPKTSTADSGTAGSRKITATVLPSNATNKKVNYKITPATAGLAVSATGEITWDETVPAGTYITEGKTEDGNFTAQHTLKLNAPNEPTMTINPYPFGDANITGTYTGEIKKTKMYVNDQYSGVIGGTFKDGNFTFYARNKFKANDRVELEGLSAESTVLVEKQLVEILPGISATYKLGANVITGECTENIEKVNVYINGQARETSDNFEQEGFEIPIVDRVDVGDEVEIEGLDKNDNIVTEKQLVEIVSEIDE